MELQAPALLRRGGRDGQPEPGRREAVHRAAAAVGADPPARGGAGRRAVPAPSQGRAAHAGRRRRCCPRRATCSSARRACARSCGDSRRPAARSRSATCRRRAAPCCPTWCGSCASSSPRLQPGAARDDQQRAGRGAGRRATSMPASRARRRAIRGWRSRCRMPDPFCLALPRGAARRRAGAGRPAAASPSTTSSASRAIAGPAYFDQSIHLCSQAGFSPRIRYEASTVHGVLGPGRRRAGRRAGAGIDGAAGRSGACVCGRCARRQPGDSPGAAATQGRRQRIDAGGGARGGRHLPLAEGAGEPRRRMNRARQPLSPRRAGRRPSERIEDRHGVEVVAPVSDLAIDDREYRDVPVGLPSPGRKDSALGGVREHHDAGLDVVMDREVVTSGARRRTQHELLAAATGAWPTPSRKWPRRRRCAPLRSPGRWRLRN